LAMTTGSLSRDAGGLFESVRSLGKALQGLGLDMAAYGLWDKNWEADAPAWKPLTAKACRYHGPRALAFSSEMDRALEAFLPDVVHLNGLWQYSSVATRRLWRKKRIPYVISPRGMLDPWALGNARWKKVLAAMIFEKALLRNAICMHALCDAEADSMRAYGLKQRIEIVPNGVVLPDLLTTEDSENSEGIKRLVFLGRIHPKKGVAGALRAWAHLKSEIGNEKWGGWQFVIAGWDQGGHESELKALCRELGLGFADKLNLVGDVIFFGPAFGEEKEKLLRSAAGFILPSLSEGLPMSVLEAWAYGLPVVMTPECNLPEGFACQAAIQIRNGKIENSKWEGLQELLDMSDSDRIEMGRKGRRLVEEKFTWTNVASRMAELYREVLGG
jgi:glycosyltransferase involved in cell wall biosynthesis